MDVRPCREQDLARLEAGNPSPGQSRFHARRFQRQQQGLSTFLIAWAADLPVGQGEIRWPGCADPEVSRRFPDCPELNGLGVWPAARRSQGIGTTIIGAAEALARERGHPRLGLGVTDDNHRAAALYLRLGYAETGCHYLDRWHGIDDHGHRRDFADPARFLVKPLPPSPRPLPKTPTQARTRHRDPARPSRPPPGPPPGTWLRQSRGQGNVAVTAMWLGFRPGTYPPVCPRPVTAVRSPAPTATARGRGWSRAGGESA